MKTLFAICAFSFFACSMRCNGPQFDPVPVSTEPAAEDSENTISIRQEGENLYLEVPQAPTE